MLSWLDVEPIKSTLEPSPLLGRCPPFDIGFFKKQLESALGTQVTTFDWQWSKISQEQARQRQPVDSSRFVFAISPLNGIAEVYIPNYQLDCISRHFFSDHGALAQTFEQSFIDYWIAMATSILFRTNPLDSFQPTPLDKSVHIKSSNVVQGLISVKSPDFEVSAQVLIDDTLHHSWLEHWRSNPYLGIDAARAQGTRLNLHLEVGQITLSSQEMLSLEVGDWISLESIGLKEKLPENHISLKLGEQKVASAKLQENSISIIGRDDFFDRLSVK